MTAQGTVYLLHFRSPYRHARHYQYCAGDVAIRVAAHQTGQGARLLAVVSQAGIGVDLVRTWPGDRSFERRLKRRHNSPRLCPVCRPAALAHNAKEATSA
jgi:hypothetical protein